MAATGGFVPLNGQSFPILTNDLADAITGIFNGLPEGQAIPAFLGSGVTAQITYVGGTGNDVVIGTNRPPVAGLVSVQRFPTQSVKIPVSQITGAATDPDPGDTISLFSVANGTNGTAQIVGGFVFYAPNGLGTSIVNQNPDTFTYVIKDNHGASATGSVTVTIAAQPNAASLSITAVTLLPGGGVAVDFSGIPGYIYGLQFKVTLADPVWQNIAPVTADQFGRGHYQDGPPPVGSTSGFYRLIFPAPLAAP